ncbi:hypothetical protein C5167_025439 [Papaver somniferum]|uniref:Uncharacterized protein n=1 Tax=Papaver somniferum TaxID=3469 RepID=A0A4Y7JRF7_PAPSO|nr:hypothetical protein C5167_025439 [Papaver somniferum]
MSSPLKFHLWRTAIAQKKPPGIVIDGLWVYKGRKTIKYDGVPGFTAGSTFLALELLSSVVSTSDCTTL